LLAQARDRRRVSPVEREPGPRLLRPIDEQPNRIALGRRRPGRRVGI